MSKKWGYLNKLCSYANADIFLKLYKSYLLSLLEYANLCWIPNNTQISEIESVQRQITKFICYKKGLTNLTYQQRLEILGIESLKLRRETKILLTVFKCIHSFNDVPDLWKDIFIVKNTRNGLLLNIPNIRFKFSDKNFFINAMKLFNSLPITIRNETKLSTFKQNVKKFLSENISF